MDTYINLIMDKLPPYIRDDRSTLVALGITVFIAFLTLVLLGFLSKSRKGSRVLLMGLSDSGKTVLFSQLVSGKAVSTFTSMKQNECHLNLERRSVVMIDIPGFDRLRDKYWNDLKKGVRAIVFVVDSYQITSNIKDVADYFYTILADNLVSSQKIPILVACNKQDKPKSKSSKVIRTLIEKEINTIRETRLAALESTDGDSENTRIVGSLDKEFAFNDLRNAIDFVDCVALAKEESPCEIEEIVNWLNKL
ncbi:signal recognition particle receptor subunit beta [Tetranychus urticae]|uniref:Signal recognition particle receptor subunit beta n=1 Tax=Tetranychus urticae TaxID=32264 RepID=T1KW28_TETUR|nr:signal recognition particle receptor subunit beta [Tetranychus urticae]